MTGYSDYFSIDSLMEKLDNLSGGGCCELIRKALTLYVLFSSDEVSASVKVLIVAALGYFICPIDAIADFIPVLGYSDDLGVMTVLLVQLDDLVSADIELEVDALMPAGCC